MTVVLLQVTATPLFEIRDAAGRPVRTFVPEQPWVLHFQDLDELKARIEAFEARATAEVMVQKESVNGTEDRPERGQSGNPDHQEQDQDERREARRQDQEGLPPPGGKGLIAMSLLLLIVLILLIVGAVPAWPYSAGWGWGPSGGLGLVLLILLILLLLGRL